MLTTFFLQYLVCLGTIFISSYCVQNVNAMHGVNATRGQPWPLPASMTTSADLLTLVKSRFQFTSGLNRCDLLDRAFKRYLLIVFNNLAAVLPNTTMPPSTLLRNMPPSTLLRNMPPSTLLRKLVVNVSTSCTEPQMPSHEMDESYTLKIGAQCSTLSSNTIWGALRGLETFSQLVYQTDEGYFVINSTVIVDKPRFPYRGVLLDTSRHFLSPEIIHQVLDGMSYNKMNVFHWHIVDVDSFPYQSKTFPELSEKGAFDQSHIYTQEDIASIIEHARVLGIRVVPEFDTPGHTLSWGKSHPELLTKCYSGGVFTGTYGPVDPSNNATYTLMEKLLNEVVTVFPDKYLHLGGDEVDFECWQSNPDISAFMKKMGFGSDYAKLEEYYMQRILDIVNGFKRATSSIIWQEVIDNGDKVPLDTIVQIWKLIGYQDELAKVTSLGLRTLLSACWYLDKISYGKDWMTYYQCDPHNFTGSDAQKKLVFGGAAALWGELVDSTNVLSLLWPRASAVAERLWSPASVKNPTKAASRLEEHRCRMVGRGIPAQPVNGPGFCPYEYRAQDEKFARRIIDTSLLPTPGR